MDRWYKQSFLQRRYGLGWESLGIRKCKSKPQTSVTSHPCQCRLPWCPGTEEQTRLLSCFHTMQGHSSPHYPRRMETGAPHKTVYELHSGTLLWTKCEPPKAQPLYVDKVSNTCATEPLGHGKDKLRVRLLRGWTLRKLYLVNKNKSAMISFT